jgi:hypothetical protein
MKKLKSIKPNRLKCRLVVNNHHPYLVLSPGKEEQISADPSIYIYYDSITDQQTQLLKNIARTKVKYRSIF